MSYYYLATPYSKFAGGIDAAHVAACQETALLLRAGVPVFSPIAHTHPIAVHGEIDPLDHGIWMPVDEPMMKAAIGMIQCRMPGWEESYGMKHELEFFERAGKPVIVMQPGMVPCLLRERYLPSS